MRRGIRRVASRDTRRAAGRKRGGQGRAERRRQRPGASSKAGTPGPCPLARSRDHVRLARPAPLTGFSSPPKRACRVPPNDPSTAHSAIPLAPSGKAADRPAPARAAAGHAGKGKRGQNLKGSGRKERGLSLSRRRVDGSLPGSCRNPRARFPAVLAAEAARRVLNKQTARTSIVSWVRTLTAGARFPAVLAA